MKSPITMQRRFLRAKRAASLIFLLLLLTHCGSKKTEVPVANASSDETASLDYETVEDKSSVAALYELDHMKEWYPVRILPPAMNYSIDISQKSVIELWLLRNEIFARNGYLFEDAVLRGYFNQFKWYQPVFDVPEFKLKLNQEEQDFINRVIARENELRDDRYIMMDAYRMINVDHVYNRLQFKEIPKAMNDQLAKTNFAIVPASYQQFFHVYDENHYQYIPNFITTDMYLQVLHKHFSTLLQKIEEEKFTPLLTGLLKATLTESLANEKQLSDPHLKKAAQWTSAYLAIAYNLISGNPQLVSDDLQKHYDDETEKIMSANGTGSEFLQSNFFQYSQFKPRGNYTKSPELENYFRSVKWLNTAPMLLDDDQRLLSAVLLASCIRSSAMEQSFQKFSKAIQFIVGDEDNLSLAHVLDLLTPEQTRSPEQFTNPEKLNNLRRKLLAVNPDKIKMKGGTSETSAELNRPFILFTAGRYTFDAEILSNMVHVLQPQPKRVFPKALDVFAALGNKEAENILINELQEGKQWSDYGKALNKMQKQFGKYDDWNKNLYTKTFETIRSVSSPDAKHPLFMKTPAWERKNLLTSLASWSELKHDMLLYAELPGGAQAGEGGGPPPPRHISYVEPNVTFWKNARNLIEHQERILTDMDLMTENVSYVCEKLKSLATDLLAISEKELAGEPLTEEEFNELTWIGGRIEQLTFTIFGSAYLPEKERMVAEIADVYRHNNTYLEEAVGSVDEIYVIAEINGKPYLTRGAVFSYYEFTNTSPLTDEEWRERLLNGNTPQRPVWLNEITVKGSLQTQPWFSF